MKSSYIILSVLILILTGFSLAQRPPRPQGPPGGGEGSGTPDWTKFVDTDKNGNIDAGEFQAAIDRSFTEFDKNGNGVLDPGEVRVPPKGGQMGPPMGQGGGRPGMNPGRPGPPMGKGGGMPGMNPGRSGPPMGQGSGQPGMQGPPMGQGGEPGGMNQGPRPGQPKGEQRFLPPFFFFDLVKEGASITKTDFDSKSKEVFASMDANHDGVLNREESRPPKGAGGPPPPPNAMFIGAELRFGDKLVTGQPFSAETVIEDTRRLYDGTTVTKQSKGAIYRDGVGRTRREQPLENIGGFNVVGKDTKPQILVFINDFATRSQYFLDLNNKVARKEHIGPGGPPPGEPDGPRDAKSESLGTKTIEGVSVQGTRVTFEIPAGQIGNDKPMQVITEKWYSPELQILVMSRHTDPLAGEHVFRLVNIKRSEPAADLFTIPLGFRIENQPARRPDR